MNNSIEHIIKNNIYNLSDDKVFINPNIPSKKLKNAIKKYAFLTNEEIPLILIDDTVFGSAKVGLLLTNKYIYFQDSMAELPYKCSLNNIQNVVFKNYLISTTLIINNKKINFTQPSKDSILTLANILKEYIGLKTEEKTSWGKIGIGAGIGMLFGGPIGAAIGAAIGASFKDSEYKAQEEYVENNSNGIIFIVTLASILAKIAKADGVITKEEANIISEIFNDLELEGKDREIALKAFNNAKNDSFSIYEYAQQYKEISDYELREYLYSILWLISLSDSKLDFNEDTILQNIPKYLGLNEDIYYRYKYKFNEKNKREENNLKYNNTFFIEECYEILGCSPNDSMAVIKKNYYKLIAEYHPDKIQSKGLSDSFIKFATEQVQKINNAYETIKKSRI